MWVVAIVDAKTSVVLDVIYGFGNDIAALGWALDFNNTTPNAKATAVIARHAEVLKLKGEFPF